MTWITIASGGSFDLAEPLAVDVKIEDIACALSRINRYTGHTRWPYSVAQHCCIVAEYCPPEFQLEALLHDAAEAYVGDISSPLKTLIPEVRKIEAKIQAVVLEAIAIKYDVTIKSGEECNRIIHEIDQRIRHDERKWVLNPCVRDWDIPGEPLDVEIPEIPYNIAERLFLLDFDRYVTARRAPT